MFIFNLHFILSLFFISLPGCFSMSPALLPAFSGPCRPPPALSFTLTTFDCLCFFIYCKRYNFEWAFFTHRRFLPSAPSAIFLIQPAFIKASLGVGSSSLKFAGLHTDLRNSGPAPLLVWITVIHNLHIQNNSVLSSTIYYHELLVVKSLVYMLLTCFELFSLVQSHI